MINTFVNIFGIDGKTFGIIIRILAILLLVGLVLYASFTIVRSDEIAIIETFGKRRRTLRKGVHFIIPIFERVVGTVKTGQQKLDFTFSVGNDVYIVALLFKVNDAGEYFYKKDEIKNKIDIIANLNKALLKNSETDSFISMMKDEINKEFSTCFEIENILVNKR